MMKTMRKVWIMVVALMLLTGITIGQSAGDGREEDHAALQVLMSKAAEALNKQDMKALAECFTKKFIFIAVDQTVLTDISAMEKYCDRMLRQKDSAVTSYQVNPVVEIPAIFLDENTGYSCGTSDDTYTLRKSKRVVHMPCRWTATVVKESDIWKIAAVHTGVNVMDNTVLKANTLPWWRKCLLAIGIGKMPGE